MKKMDKKEGHIHPLSLVIADIGKIFTEMGFEIAQGLEIETEYYNFEALNIPENHPARDMWDTFWLTDNLKGVKDNETKQLLRTHTSPVQIRYMETHKPPIKIIVPGKCYRHEATDATHEAEFYQTEGLFIDKNISMADLKGILEKFFTKLLGSGAKIKVRFRANYFPFVEPGAEVDMSCFKCEGKPPAKGCNICKNKGWIEIAGAGMVHPFVLNKVGIDSKKYSGFAFGCGIERLAMIKYGINDIRLFHSGNLRFTNQF